MSRGVRGGLIYKDDRDFDLFLQIVRECQKVQDFKIHSFCLMSNHFHMQIETGEVSLSRIMEKMLKMYANNFNAKYHFDGHVFQGRYKGILIEDPVYFLETGRYIHLNPVKAGMVRKAEDYQQSSYRNYIFAESSDIIFKDKTLDYFRDADPLEYAKFVEARADHENYEKEIMTCMGEDDNWLPW